MQTVRALFFSLIFYPGTLLFVVVGLAAGKHQSMFETIEMLRVAQAPIVVLKRELADLPLWGAIARRYGVIPVDREAGSKALREMLAAAKVAKASGRPV